MTAGLATALVTRFRRHREFLDGFRRATDQCATGPPSTLLHPAASDVAISEPPMYFGCDEGMAQPCCIISHRSELHRIASITFYRTVSTATAYIRYPRGSIGLACALLKHNGQYWDSTGTCKVPWTVPEHQVRFRNAGATSASPWEPPNHHT